MGLSQERTATVAPDTSAVLRVLDKEIREKDAMRKQCALCGKRVWWWQPGAYSDGTFSWHKACRSEQPTVQLSGNRGIAHPFFGIFPPEVLAAQHRERFRPVYGDAIIANESEAAVYLEGPLLKRLPLAAGARHRIASPIVERQWDRQYEHWKLIEHDAKDVLTDMIAEYERGLRANTWNPYDELHFPPPWSFSKGMLLEQSKLKAFRARGAEA